MRKILIKQLEPGMVLGKSVLASNGFVLLPAGAELNQSYIDRLQNMGFPAVLVKDIVSDSLDYPDLIPERSRIDGIKVLKDIFTTARNQRQIDTKKVKDLVNALIDQVQRNRQDLYETADIRMAENYIYGHSLNVCIHALRLGFHLHYNELQLRDLGVGAILHDIGSLFIEDTENIKGHSVLGFNFLREQKDINLLSAHVALQHHERVDGKGYPRSLKDTEICEFARIVTIADMFDALTSDRADRTTYSLPAAVRILTEAAGIKVDSYLTNLFLRGVALYPTGSLVELSTGEIGLVIRNNQRQTHQPVVRIVKESDSRDLSLSGPEINLTENSSLAIIQIIEH